MFASLCVMGKLSVRNIAIGVAISVIATIVYEQWVKPKFFTDTSSTDTTS